MSCKNSMKAEHFMEAVPHALVGLTRQGECCFINAKARSLLGEAASPQCLSGLLEVLPGALSSALGSLWQTYLTDLTSEQSSNCSIVAAVQGKHYQLHLIPVDDNALVGGVLLTIEDITQEVHKEIQLDVFRQGVGNYRELHQNDARWDFMLEALKRLTNSQYALIGETVTQKNSALYSLRVHAVSDLSWNESSRQLMQRLRSGEMTLSNPDSILGRVFAYGETVLTDDLAGHPHKTGFPPGHPEIFNFLGVPIYDGERLVGMFGVANAPQGYHIGMARELAPFTTTCALLINLYRDSKTREKVLKRYAVAKDKAQAANRAKNDFLSSMSHELRTPLNAILGYVQLLNDVSDLPLETQLYIKHIDDSGNHLLALIGDLLDFANIEAELLPADLKPVALQPILDRLCHQVQGLASKHAITLKPWDSRGYYVMADAERVQRVLFQLVSNAIKYQPQGGSVDIIIEKVAQQVAIHVMDEGIGIDPAYHADVFTPFNRLEASKGTIEGTGVGLSLALKLAKSLGGTVTLKSEPSQSSTRHHAGKHVGADFTLWLQYAKRPIKSHADHSGTQEIPLKKEAEYNGARVLYIEDNRINQRLMERAFSKWHLLSLDIAESAEQGLEKLSQSSYDLVLMDISLPGMDGYAALKKIRATPTLASLPVIAVTAHASDTEIHRGREAGFDDYVTKPVKLNLLKQMIHTYLN
ncbi:response regulator [Halomonas alkaliantarctica]|nr:response regulator [Halomonas alkaliantarctica]